MFKGKVLLFSLLMVFATSLYAGDVDECESDVGITCALRVSICPSGDMELIRNGCTPPGASADYIWVFIRDANGDGIPEIPWSDYWIQACDETEELCLCAQPLFADSLTNSLGRTTFSGTIAGGGCVTTYGVWIACQGKTIMVNEEPPCTTPICLIDMIIVSPDLNADCLINLADLTYFGESYNKILGEEGYDTCCDYNDDDICNLADFTYLGEHYQHGCF